MRPPQAPANLIVDTLLRAEVGVMVLYDAISKRARALTLTKHQRPLYREPA